MENYIREPVMSYIEYEVKFLNVNEMALKHKLQTIGAKLIQPRQLQRRVIFENLPSSRERSWLRLRDEGEKTTLALKWITKKGIDGTSEIQLTVEDFSTAQLLLCEIGLKQKRYEENFREIWSLGEIEYDFDTWPDLPTYLEIEGPSENKVRDAAFLLDLDFSDATFGTVDEFYLKLYNRNILLEDKLVFDQVTD